MSDLLDMDINQADAVISKLPTDRIREFKNSLSAHFVKASTTGEYKKEFELMLKKYETYIIMDEIEFNNHCRSIANAK